MSRTGFASRAAVTFGLLIVIVLTLGLAAVYQTDRINGSLQRAWRSRLPKLELARSALRYSTENNRITMEIFLLDDPAEIRRLMALRSANTNAITDLHQRILRVLDSGDETELFRWIRGARQPYVASYLKALDLLLERRDPAAARRVMVAETLPLLRAYHAALSRFVEFENQRMLEESDEANREATSARTRILGLLGIALLTIGIIGFATTASMVRAIEKRRVAEDRLRASHAALEARVQERTAQLAAVNDALEIDVARRMSAEAELQRSVARYRLLFERTLYGVIRNRFDGFVLNCNDAAARFLGLGSRSELIGRNIQDFYADPERRGEALAALERGDSGCLIEIEFRRADGKPAWALVNLVAVEDPDNADERVIEGVLLDITDRKRLLEQFQQSQKMEAVGRLAGGIAHDFNNLLTAILGYTSDLLDGQTLAPDAREALEEVRHAGLRASSLTRQLLAFSRKQVLVPEVLDLKTVIPETEKMLRRLIGEDIALTTSLSAELDPVRADRGQIEQVIVNLAVNSRDAMPRGGTLSIEARNVGLDEAIPGSDRREVAGPLVMISVRDTGSGMDAETRSHLFEPFFTTKEKGKGTGLGLATVYGIVEQSGGFLSVESAPERGAEFRIFLPSAAPVVAATTARTEPVSAEDGSGTILLVEDEDLVRRLVQTLLDRAGYETVSARDGEDALRRVREHGGAIDLVLTDVVMPGMSGPELVRQLAAAGRRYRVLYMSGYAGSAMVPEAILDSRNQFVQKPFTPEGLLRSVRDALERPAAAILH